MLPKAYHALSHMVDHIAGSLLTNPFCRVTFRLFDIGHGKTAEQDRATMKPIFSTTCGLRSYDDPRTCVVERTIDEDFALCRRNEGCARCR